MASYRRRPFAAAVSVAVLFGAVTLSFCPGLTQAADASLAGPLVATEAVLGNERFFIRYESAAGEFYSGGSWTKRIDLELHPEGRFQGPYLVPLEYHQPERWAVLPKDAISVRVLPVEHWRSIKARLFSAVMPEEPGAGLVINFSQDDYFIYRHGDGPIMSVLLRHRPAGFRIAGNLSMVGLLESGKPVVEAYLAEQGIEDRRLVLNTGDTGPYSLPFLYLNLDWRMAVFARLDPGAGRVARAPVIPAAQTLGHIAHSHLTGIAVRPLSSLKRLFFVLTDTVSVPLQGGPVDVPSGYIPPPLAASSGMDLAAWELHLDRFTGRKASSGTIEYLVDGEEFFPRLIGAVEAAKTAIHMRTYIFDNDDFAASIGRLLRERADSGVDVKVLLDGLGTIISTTETQESLPPEHQAPPSVRAFLEGNSSVKVRQTPNPWMTGDHVKTTIIDGEIGFMGGMNIAREYRYDWHDLMVELRGPVVGQIQSEFDEAWAHAGVLGDLGWFLHKLRGQPDRQSRPMGYPIRLLYTRPENAEIFRVQREAIRRATDYIFVENAYFTDDSLLKELIDARRRGVDVRVIVPIVTDRGALTRDNALAANVMLANGIRVYIYPGMSHIKAAIYDGWVCLGSANFDRFSMKINHEMNLATSHPPAARELQQRLFEEDFARSPELLVPFPERWSDHLVEVLGDYIF
ncbi:MAG: phospholipase D-like domain-containing protein [Gammaproteobacteria bacterium]